MGVLLRRVFILPVWPEGVNMGLDKAGTHHLLFLPDQIKLIDRKYLMVEAHEIETVEQLRAIADILRLRYN